MASSNESVAPTAAEITTFDKMIGILNAYKRTQIFRSALDLGLFKIVHGEPKTAEDIAARCKVGDSKRLQAVLDMLVLEGFIQRQEGSGGSMLYENSQGMDLLLGDEKSPTYISFMDMMIQETQTEVDGWASFTELLKTGKIEKKSHDGHDQHAGEGHDHGCGGAKSEGESACEKANKGGIASHVVDDSKPTEEETEEWDALYAMFEGFMRIGFNVLAERFDFSRFAHVLDIGGGSAQFSRILCRRYKNIRCTNFDLPRTIPVAEKRMAASGADVADRITLVAGDCFKDDLPTPVNAIVIANVMHGFAKEDLAKEITQKSFNALSPGGVFIVIEDTICDNTTQEALLWQLGSDVSTAASDHHHGEGHEHITLTLDGLKAWFKAAGFTDNVQTVPMVGGTVAVVATKA